MLTSSISLQGSVAVFVTLFCKISSGKKNWREPPLQYAVVPFVIIMPTNILGKVPSRMQRPFAA
jgi:hypothetical protein